MIFLGSNFNFSLFTDTLCLFLNFIQNFNSFTKLFILIIFIAIIISFMGKLGDIIDLGAKVGTATGGFATAYIVATGGGGSGKDDDDKQKIINEQKKQMEELKKQHAAQLKQAQQSCEGKQALADFLKSMSDNTGGSSSSN